MFTSKSSSLDGSLSKQAANSADVAIQATLRAADGALNTLADGVGEIRDQAAPMIQHAGAEASALMHQGVDSVRHAGHQVQVAAQRASDRTLDYVRDQPVKSLLMAAAVGALVVLATSRVTR